MKKESLKNRKQMVFMDEVLFRVAIIATKLYEKIYCNMLFLGSQYERNLEARARKTPIPLIEIASERNDESTIERMRVSLFQLELLNRFFNGPEIFSDYHKANKLIEFSKTKGDLADVTLGGFIEFCGHE